MYFARAIVYINGLESVTVSVLDTDSVVDVLLVTASVFVMDVDKPAENPLNMNPKSPPIAISVVSVIKI